MARPPTENAGLDSLALLYFATAHVAFALACALAVLWPRSVAGFFYHSWMVALVHLVTLGWITMSIFGCCYSAGPLTPGTANRVGRLDYVAYGSAVAGLIGMVAHFWIEQYSGMAWSAATIAGAALYVTGRIVRTTVGASVHATVKLQIVFACANLWLAALMGVLVAMDKASPFLPGYVLSNVFAHAHLAAIGWAAMILIGIAYSTLPLVLESRMPPGTAATPLVLETGVLGLFTALLLQSRWSLFFGVVIAAGLALFVAHVIWMLRHPLSARRSVRRFEFDFAHAACAGAALMIAVVFGLLLLAVRERSNASLHVAAAYGVVGLVGCFAQLLVAIETRLLPIAARHWASVRRGRALPPVTPRDLRDRTLQGLVLAGWVLGVPALTLGLGLESARLVAIGGTALFSAVSIAAVDHVYVVAVTARSQGATQDRA